MSMNLSEGEVRTKVEVSSYAGWKFWGMVRLAVTYLTAATQQLQFGPTESIRGMYFDVPMQCLYVLKLRVLIKSLASRLVKIRVPGRLYQGVRPSFHETPFCLDIRQRMLLDCISCGICSSSAE